jgi:hypothetical protein
MMKQNIYKSVLYIFVGVIVSCALCLAVTHGLFDPTNTIGGGK